MKLTKEEVATRQLNTAIRLFFNAADVVSVHTLAAASANVFADLLDNTDQTSWREKITEGHPDLTKQQAFKILKKAQNFFKHANHDHKESLEFPETDNDEMIFIATLEYGLLLQGKNQNGKEREMLSVQAEVFQLWSLAMKLGVSHIPETKLGIANRIFGEIKELPRLEQLSKGAAVLKWRESQ